MAIKQPADKAREIAESLSGQKYRPSSGTEGAMFMDRFCYRCKRDAEFRAGTGDSCPIAANALVYGRPC